MLGSHDNVAILAYAEEVEVLVPLGAVGDARSRAIVRQMQQDEAEHGQAAQEAGARPLPEPIPTLMTLASKLMKAVAYRF